MFRALWSAIVNFFSVLGRVEPAHADLPQIEVTKEQEEELVATGNPSAPNWTYLWSMCRIDEARKSEVARVCKTIMDNKMRYMKVQNDTNVPWYLIAAIHLRESSLNFSTYLHNGQQLGMVTTNVPKGIFFPKGQWEAAAVDALRRQGMDKIGYPDVPACLVVAQRYNGLSYQRMGLEYSPYIWAATNNHDETGKFIRDHVYSETAQEKQLGIAAVIRGLGIL